MRRSFPGRQGWRRRKGKGFHARRPPGTGQVPLGAAGCPPLLRAQWLCPLRQGWNFTWQKEQAVEMGQRNSCRPTQREGFCSPRSGARAEWSPRGVQPFDPEMAQPVTANPGMNTQPGHSFCKESAPCLPPGAAFYLSVNISCGSQSCGQCTFEEDTWKRKISSPHHMRGSQEKSENV